VTVNGAGQVTFNAAQIASLTDFFGGGSYSASVEMVDSNGCIGSSSDSSMGGTLPACCFATPAPVVTEPSSKNLRTVATVTCPTTVRITKITLTIDNSNGQAAEKFDVVKWGTTTIWDGNDAGTIVIDLAANPLVMTYPATQNLNVLLTRDGSGDYFTVKYDYRVGGTPGACTFGPARVP